MNKTSLIVSLLLAAGPVTAEVTKAGSLADKTDTIIIGAEARCMQSRGIPIEEVSDDKVKVACLQDAEVQRACNPDGSHARQNAFREWSSDLMDFKERCTSVGGTFAFADPKFQEPSSASFCSLAQPEVNYSDFETPMCNFVSRCPRVAVSCIKTEDVLQSSLRTVQLPGIPKPVAVSY